MAKEMSGVLRQDRETRVLTITIVAPCGDHELRPYVATALQEYLAGCWHSNDWEHFAASNGVVIGASHLYPFAEVE